MKRVSVVHELSHCPKQQSIFFFFSATANWTVDGKKSGLQRQATLYQSEVVSFLASPGLYQHKLICCRTVQYFQNNYCLLIVYFQYN